MTTARFTATSTSDAQARAVGWALNRVYSRQRLWLPLLWVAILALVGQGALQHWHEPQHLAEQMQVMVAADQDAGVSDEHRCPSCALLKLGQIATLNSASLAVADSAVPLLIGANQAAADLRLPQPVARGPPDFSNIIVV
ncbi:hypothetical protein N9W78_02080 [bacterium]|nr:hypothetical protein [bacterium]